MTNDPAQIRISADDRKAIRAAVSSHPKWPEWRALNSMRDLGTITTKEDWCAVANWLGINLTEIIEAARAAGTDATEEEATAMARDNDLITALERAIDSKALPAQKHEDAVSIASKFAKYGALTSRQRDYASALIRLFPVVYAKPVETKPAPKPVAADSKLALLEQLLSGGMSREEIQAIVDSRVNERLEGIPSVRIEITDNSKPIGAVEGHSHPMLATLLKVCSTRDSRGFGPNVWISGPAGSGKTHAARTVAQSFNLDFGMHGTMAMTHELMGFIDGHGHYHTTEFRKRFEHGGVILLDEIDGWDPVVTLALNGALANGYASFPDGMVDRHPDCIVIACANTWGSGATADYVGRNRLDAAFLSRFPVKLAWPYDVAMEIALAGNYASWARRVQGARERARAAGLKVLIDPRHTYAGATLLAAGMAEDEVAKLTYQAGLTAEQVRMVEGR